MNISRPNNDSDEDENELLNICLHPSKSSISKDINDKNYKRAKEYRKIVEGRTWSLSGVHGNTNEPVLFEINSGFEIIKLKLFQSIDQQFRIWDSAIVLSRHLEQSPCYVSGKRILELGCGIGLPGITAHVLGASQTFISDREVCLEHNRKNLALNSFPSSTIQAVALEWNNFTLTDYPNLSQINVILLSDVIYAGDSETTAQLSQVILSIEPKTILNCYEERYLSSSKSLKQLETCLMTKYDIEDQTIPKLYRNNYIFIKKYNLKVD